MIATAIIAFREFLEAFLIVGVFFGISKKLHLEREKEIGFAAFCGIVISLLLASGTYLFGDYARGILTEKNADVLESYLLIFSGFFIAYVVFSLHSVMNKSRGGKLLNAHKKLQESTFDISLFFTIVFLVIREGFEIALFTASVSLFSAFLQNMIGFLLGFFAAGIMGVATFFTYTRFSVGKIFKVTEYMIILLGASLVQNGLTGILEHSFGVNISAVLRFPLDFIPSKETVFGHLLQSLIGIDQNFSLARLVIMLVYCGVIYWVFMRQNKQQKF